jgi:hypothetical protein
LHIPVEEACLDRLEQVKMTLLAYFVGETFLLSDLLQFGILVVEKKSLQKVYHSVLGLAAEVFYIFKAANIIEPVKLDSCFQVTEGSRKLNHRIRLDVQDL